MATATLLSQLLADLCFCKASALYSLSDPELLEELPELAVSLLLPDPLDEELREKFPLEDAAPDPLLLPPACILCVIIPSNYRGLLLARCVEPSNDRGSDSISAIEY